MNLVKEPNRLARLMFDPLQLDKFDEDFKTLLLGDGMFKQYADDKVKQIVDNFEKKCFARRSVVEDLTAEQYQKALKDDQYIGIELIGVTSTQSTQDYKTQNVYSELNRAHVGTATTYAKTGRSSIVTLYHIRAEYGPKLTIELIRDAHGYLRELDDKGGFDRVAYVTILNNLADKYLELEEQKAPRKENET